MKTHTFIFSIFHQALLYTKNGYKESILKNALKTSKLETMFIGTLVTTSFRSSIYRSSFVPFSVPVAFKNDFSIFLNSEY